MTETDISGKKTKTVQVNAVQKNEKEIKETSRHIRMRAKIEGRKEESKGERVAQKEEEESSQNKKKTNRVKVDYNRRSFSVVFSLFSAQWS